MVTLRTVRALDLLQRARTIHEERATAVTPAKSRRVFLSWPIRWIARFHSAFAAGNRAVLRVLRQLADADDVLQYLQTAAARDDERRSGNWDLARYLLQLKDFNSAGNSGTSLQAALSASIESVDPLIRVNAAGALARVLFSRGEYAESAAASELALRVSPADPRALRSKAHALIALGNIEEGRQIYANIAAAAPESIEVNTKVRALSSLPERIVRASRRAIPEKSSAFLIGVGGGIGDLLHATPAIRNIAERSGSPVDVVVFADHPGAEFLLKNPHFTNRVLPVCPEVFDRRYDTVFLTHSFGPLRFPFGAERVVASDDWRAFRPGGLPETVFNLEAAKALLGISFEETDANGYFVADLERRRPKEILVGFHAGSKTGRWLSKRWPHFMELGRRLTARGVRVASFGTCDEYVAGTEDCTGGSIEEMCRSMLDCTHFISNDSGAMHIASALGMPVLALFAPTDPLTHLPLRASTVGLAVEKRCAPCEVRNHRYFASGSCRCVTEIGVKSVERKVLEMLDLDMGNINGFSAAPSAGAAEGRMW